MHYDKVDSGADKPERNTVHCDYPLRMKPKRRFKAGPLLWLLKFAFLSAFRQPRRTLVAVSTLSSGVIGLMLAQGFIEWNLWFGRESTIRSQLGHIRICRPGYLEEGQADPFRYLIKGAAAELKLVESTAGVRTVAPRLSFAGLISHGDSTLSFLGEGVDPEKEALLSESLTIVKGQGLDSADPQGFVLGQGLAENLGVKIGDEVVLLANTASGGMNAVQGHVRGFFATITKAYDDIAMRVPIAQAQTLLKTPGTHYWAVLLTDTDYTSKAVELLRPQLAADSFLVVPWTDLADFYNKTAVLLRRQLAVMQILVAIIIVLSISNTLTITVMERTREIGTAMALGVRKAMILRQFLLEGVVLGIVGSVVGAAVGMLLAYVISRVGIPMPPAPGMSQGFTAKILVTPWITLQGCAVVTLSCLVASVYPAWRASSLEIVDALRQGR